MAYSKQNWSDLPSQTTPLSAARLNHLETQYDEAKDYADGILVDAKNYTDAEVGGRIKFFTGTSSERNSFTTAPDGVHWQDTDGSKYQYVRQGGSWVALKIDDTGWVDFSLTYNTTTCKYRIVGGLVDLRITVFEDVSANTVVNLGKIPVEARPDDTLALACNSSGGYSSFAYLDPAGDVRLRNNTSGTRDTYWVSGTYLV